MSSADLTVTIAQPETPGDLETGLRLAEAWVRRAQEVGARVLAFPETWLPGYPAWLDVCRDVGLWDHGPVKRAFRRMVEEAVTVPGPVTRRLGTLARDAGVTLVIGVIERVDSGPGQGTLYNTLLTIGPDGRLLNRHRKLVPTHTERMLWGPGDGAGLRAVETPAGRIGGLVCWEHWMPLARQALHQGGEEVHVAAWPWVHELHQIASRHYAFEGRCVVLAAGSLQWGRDLPPDLELDPHRVPDPDTLILRGGSAIIGPDGRYLAEPVYDREELLVASLDPGRRYEDLMTLDVSGHYARPDLFRFAVRKVKPGRAVRVSSPTPRQPSENKSMGGKD